MKNKLLRFPEVWLAIYACVGPFTVSENITPPTELLLTISSGNMEEIQFENKLQRFLLPVSSPGQLITLVSMVDE